jgi:TonB-dependent receptor
MASLLRVAASLVLSATLTIPLIAQGGSGGGSREGAPDAPGAIAGRVTDSATTAIAGASVRLLGTPYVARTRDDGSFRIENLAAGTYRVLVTGFGFAADSTTVTVASGGEAQLSVHLRPVAFMLERVMSVAHRMGETQAAALDFQKEATNLVSVLPGDQIRGLPNYNAAEAAGRMPDVGIERDEGEGKFVQIRGTEPRLSNVTINGVHVPGTENGNRIPKLDAVPSDLLAAIEVSKTLSADMDADAIGGSVNLVTKTPEGSPHGYIAGQYGRIGLLSRDVGQTSVTYGGRFGQDSRLGLLLGGSFDRNNRGINDVEPSWAVDSTGRSFPNEWSQRDYTYYRTRYGLGGDIDYRFNDHSSVYLKGLWSLFLNHGTRYVYDISTGASAFADTANKSALGDSAASGPTGYGTGAVVTREVSQRTPTEQMWGFKAGARHEMARFTVDYSLDYAGTRQSTQDYRFSPFRYSGSGGQGLTIHYDASNITVPLYSYISAAEAAAAANPNNFALSGYDAINGLTTGRDLGGTLNVLSHYGWGEHPGALKLGLRLRDEAKHYTQNSPVFRATGTLTLAQVLGGFSDPNFYSSITNAYQPYGPVPDLNATQGWENANPGAFTNTTDTIGNALASFSGSERVYAGYVMNTVDFGPLRVNVGLRLEATRSDYIGHVSATDTTKTPQTTVTSVSATQTYTDLFPSAQLRYQVDENTNVRVAITRAIARPNYYDVAPHLTGNVNTSRGDFSNISAGNPNLKAQHAWNFDLLMERFLPSWGGVISGGVFYKSLTDVILTRDFIYQGPYAPLVGFAGTQKQNGGSGHLLGFEANWVQHLTFLPGVLGGLGFDANWTHVDSKVLVDPVSGREAPLLRQSPNLANVSATYDRGPISSRLTWTYNGESIAGYGDGSATATGDNYFYAHSQIDGSVIYNLTTGVQLQFMALNINNAVFGFFNGTPDHAYNFQREYYGPTFYLGAKYGF